MPTLRQNSPNHKSLWCFDHPKSQRERRDQTHADVCAAFKRRLHQLKRAEEADEIRQTAEIASWIANESERKVEFMASLWVGRKGLKEGQLRRYVGKLTSNCHAFMKKKLENLEISKHFMIVLVFERSSQKNEDERRLHAHLLICASKDALPHFRLWRGERGRSVKRLWREIVSDKNIWGECCPSVKVRSVRHYKGGPEGTVLYLLKEVGKGSSSHFEPAETEMPDEGFCGETTAGASKPARLRLRRKSRADEQEIIAFRSVRADGVSQDAILRRRMCGLSVPKEWNSGSES